MKYILITLLIATSAQAHAYDFSRASEQNQRAQENMQREIEQARQERAIQEAERSRRDDELRTRLGSDNTKTSPYFVLQK